jgi:hypothetical protein
MELTNIVNAENTLSQPPIPYESSASPLSRIRAYTRLYFNYLKRGLNPRVIRENLHDLNEHLRALIEYAKRD